MSESKGKIPFVILAVLLLLFGGGTILYPSLNGLWVERTMHRDSEDFLLLLEEDAERTAEENSHVIPGDPGTRETAEPQMPLEHTQLWLDMKAYNEAIFREGQKGLADPSAYEDVCFRLSDYGLDSEVFGVLSIPKLNLQMPMLGWSLFVVGVVVAVFEVAIESQSGRVNVKGTALNVLKGFFAASLVGVLPVQLYKTCCHLQGIFTADLAGIFAGEQSSTIGAFAGQILSLAFDPNAAVQVGLKLIFFLLAFAYCVIKVFFANIKRGGILLVQTAVGSLYLFSVPRGYTDGFYQWCKQVIAICLTAFMQTTLLFLGMMTFQNNMLLGLGIMLAAGEVPRIAQQFGLDSSVRVNMSSVIYSTSSAVNLTRNLMKAKPA